MSITQPNIKIQETPWVFQRFPMRTEFEFLDKFDWNAKKYSVEQKNELKSFLLDCTQMYSYIKTSLNSNDLENAAKYCESYIPRITRIYTESVQKRFLGQSKKSLFVSIWTSGITQNATEFQSSNIFFELTMATCLLAYIYYAQAIKKRRLNSIESNKSACELFEKAGYIFQYAGATFSGKQGMSILTPECCIEVCEILKETCFAQSEITKMVHAFNQNSEVNFGLFSKVAMNISSRYDICAKKYYQAIQSEDFSQATLDESFFWFLVLRFALTRTECLYLCALQAEKDTQFHKSKGFYQRAIIYLEQESAFGKKLVKELESDSELSIQLIKIKTQAQGTLNYCDTYPKDKGEDDTLCYPPQLPYLYSGEKFKWAPFREDCFLKTFGDLNKN